MYGNWETGPHSYELSKLRLQEIANRVEMARPHKKPRETGAVARVLRALVQAPKGILARQWLPGPVHGKREMISHR